MRMMNIHAYIYTSVIGSLHAYFQCGEICFLCYQYVLDIRWSLGGSFS